MNKNFIALEASAGSGKTHNLTRRYLSLLLNFDTEKQEFVPLRNILALTFTNKATVEMKERIIDSLKKTALNYDIKDLTEDINLPKEKIARNAVIAINDLIQNYDKFNVKTTDSFINLIIKACALKLGISPNYKILDSYKDYTDYATDSFLDKVLVSKDVEDILNYFFEQFLIDSSDSWNIKGFILNKFEEFYGKDVSKQKIILGEKKEYLKILSILSSEFTKVCSDMEKIKEFEGAFSNIQKAVEKVKQDKKYLLKNYKSLSTYFNKDKIQYKAKMPESEKLNELFCNAKKIIKDFCEYRAFRYYDTYLQIFNYVIDEFDNRSQKDSVLLLQDINRKISEIFRSTLMPEIYYRLSDNFKDFLVDEFQDTSKIQWETLKLIVEENLSQNGSFFYVGDKKQAIYGFRGSDFQIFDIPLKEFADYSPQKFALKTNYRSCQAIVDFNNSVFSSHNISNFVSYVVDTGNIINAEKYCKELIDVFASSEQQIFENNRNKGYVEISSYQYSKGKSNEDIDDKVREYIYKKIDELSVRFAYKDITILCRKNDEVEKISKWLLDKNINIESFKTLNIKNSGIIKELFSVLQFLNTPMDNIAFVSFITGDIFLKQTGLNKNEIKEFLYKNSLSAGKDNNVLYIKFREKYPQVWQDYIEEFFKSAGFIAVYELTVSIIAKFKILDNFKDYGSIVLRFLELISDFETKQQGLQNFIDYFKDNKNEENEKFFIKTPSQNAVKIMSIHKAKGLQFNVVIMPYFSLGTVKVENPFLMEKDDKISFVRIEKDITSYSDILNDIYYKTYFKSLSDELNILYVATTRAVYEFYGLITTSSEGKKKPIDVLVNQDVRILGNPQIYKNEKYVEKESSDIKITATQPEDITDLICDSATEIYGKKDKDLLLRGRMIHYALSLIESFDDKTFCDEINNAVKETELIYSEQNTKKLREKITELLSKSDIAEFFDKKNKVFNEKEFVDKYGNTVRLDKLVIKDDEIDIIDYKTSIYDKEYIRKQLKNYSSVIKEIYPNKEIKCYVIETEKVAVSDFSCFNEKLAISNE